MYNLNVDLAASAASAVNTLLVESTGTTPRTPEILNSLIAMTNPLDGYSFVGDESSKKTHHHHSNRLSNGCGSLTMNSSDSNSSCSSQLESPTTNPPSVQHTCSQLIKAGLKLTIEQKRKHQSDGEDLLDLDKVKRVKKTECSESEEDKVKQENGLTPEDEERRRRRRERNKIAATKCRLKKRERTANLIQESETLETQNIELKNQLQDLQNQKLTLSEMLAIHRPVCQRNIGPVTREHLYRLPPVTSVMDGNSYGRTTAAQQAACYRHLDNQYNSARARFNNKPPPPEIIIEDIGDGYDLDQFAGGGNLDSFSYDMSSPCHNYSGSYNSAELGNGCMA